MNGGCYDCVGLFVDGCFGEVEVYIEVVVFVIDKDWLIVGKYDCVGNDNVCVGW